MPPAFPTLFADKVWFRLVLINLAFSILELILLFIFIFRRKVLSAFWAGICAGSERKM